MSWGATIITTNAGELPSTVDESCAVFLDPPTPVSIANAIDHLADDGELRKNLALAGLLRFRDRFRRNTYMNVWIELLAIDR